MNALKGSYNHYEFRGDLIYWNGEGVYHLSRSALTVTNRPFRWHKCTEIFDVEAAMRDGNQVLYVTEADIVLRRNHS